MNITNKEIAKQILRHFTCRQNKGRRYPFNVYFDGEWIGGGWDNIKQYRLALKKEIAYRVGKVRRAIILVRRSGFKVTKR